MTRNFFSYCSDASDKIHRHGYQRFYDTFLSGLRNNNPRVLEIGVEDAKSIELWQQYFVNPEITAIDILDKSVPKEVRFIRCDQSSATELTDLVRQFTSPFDFIIDDGSHVPNHQLLTLQILWDTLAPGGIYIIEDIETSYWGKSSLFGYDFDSGHDSLIRKLTPFIDVVNREYSAVDSVSGSSSLFDVARDTEMITFGANCVVLVKKNAGLYSQYYDREYCLSHKVNERSVYQRVKRRLSIKAKGF